jgi:hypothetical protein
LARTPRLPIDYLHVKAWYWAVSIAADGASYTKLERMFSSPEPDRRDLESGPNLETLRGEAYAGRQKSTNIWKRYRDGKATPRRYLPKIFPPLVDAVELQLAGKGTKRWFMSLLWRALNIECKQHWGGMLWVYWEFPGIQKLDTDGHLSMKDGSAVKYLRKSFHDESLESWAAAVFLLRDAFDSGEFLDVFGLALHCVLNKPSNPLVQHPVIKHVAPEIRTQVRAIARIAKDKWSFIECEYPELLRKTRRSSK